MDFKKEIELLKSEQDRAILNMAYSQMLRYQETRTEDDLDFFCEIVEGMGRLLTDEGAQILHKMIEVNVEV